MLRSQQGLQCMCLLRSHAGAGTRFPVILFRSTCTRLKSGWEAQTVSRILHTHRAAPQSHTRSVAFYDISPSPCILIQSRLTRRLTRIAVFTSSKEAPVRSQAVSTNDISELQDASSSMETSLPPRTPKFLSCLVLSLLLLTAQPEIATASAEVPPQC